MPLFLAPVDKDVKIVKTGFEGNLKKHMESLGFAPESTIKVLSVSAGNIICLIKGTRLAVDKTTASRIMVSVN